MSLNLLEEIRTRVLLCDGAMGTQLQQLGLEPGGCGEAWNLIHADRLLTVQRAYVDAGSDCLLTNTFGGSRIMLERHDHAGDVTAINAAGVELARQAFGGRPGFVIGDIGPFGGLMEPHGDISPQRVREAFTEQAMALVSAGGATSRVRGRRDCAAAAAGGSAGRRGPSGRQGAHGCAAACAR